ncbi:hypothetical protein B0H34DRAFT_505552 [Crassisporium funariophilum]|nr:hypothetical protein B0H34DRAFT_505552 [Crassisporium funariophilum]
MGSTKASIYQHLLWAPLHSSTPYQSVHVLKPCRVSNATFLEKMPPASHILSRLSVFIFSCDYNPIILDCLTLPNLRKLRFDADNDSVPETRSMERVAAMLGISACQLNDFTFDRYTWYTENLTSQLLSLPVFASLQSLTINSDVAASLVKDLTVLPHSGPEWELQSKGAVLLPNLTSMVMVECRVEDGLLLEMARSRVRNSRCAHLKYLRVQGGWDTEDSLARDVNDFQRLKEEGLEFSLTFQSKPSW